MRVWDLARDAHVPVCEQRVAARAALTRLAFSAAHPVMLIGDERCAPRERLVTRFAVATFRTSRDMAP